MRLRSGLMVLAAMGAVLAGSQALAAEQPLSAAGAPKGETPHLANGHPDLSGYWRRRGDPSGLNVLGVAFTVPGPNDPNQHMREGNQNYLEIDAEFFMKHSQDMPQYKPEYWDQIRKNEEFGYRRPADPMYGCKSPGPVRLGSPMEIYETPLKVTLIYPFPLDDATSAHLWVREIATDGHPLPKSDDYQGVNAMGVSSARWDGDTLVIETVDFPTDGVWYNVRGWVGSAEAKIIERLRRQGDTLFYDVTIDDPAFVKPWVRPTQVSTVDDTAAGLVAQPLPCIERDGDLLPGGASGAPATK